MQGAVDALAKISAVLPEAMRDAVQDERLLLPPTDVERDSINTRVLHQDFRHFRTDGISICKTLVERYKERRLDLIARWRATEP